jgi:hypothetical protein
MRCWSNSPEFCTIARSCCCKRADLAAFLVYCNANSMAAHFHLHLRVLIQIASQVVLAWWHVHLPAKVTRASCSVL